MLPATSFLRDWQNSNKANSSIFSFAVIPPNSTQDLTMGAGFVFVAESNTNYGIFRTSNEIIAGIHDNLSANMTITKEDTTTLRIVNGNSWNSRCWMLKY